MHHLGQKMFCSFYLSLNISGIAVESRNVVSRHKKFKLTALTDMLWHRWLSCGQVSISLLSRLIKIALCIHWTNSKTGGKKRLYIFNCWEDWYSIVNLGNIVFFSTRIFLISTLTYVLHSSFASIHILYKDFENCFETYNF